MRGHHILINSPTLEMTNYAPYLYSGDFVRGARDGRGMFFYASGAIYDGCWKDNLKHGPGKFVFKNGRIYEGIFEYDHMVEHPDLVLERLSTPGT